MLEELPASRRALAVGPILADRSALASSNLPSPSRSPSQIDIEETKGMDIIERIDIERYINHNDAGKDIVLASRPLSSLKTHHSRAPIFSLPPEILAHIFTLYSLNERSGTLYGPAGQPLRSVGCVAVTHVCRWWRSVALKHARLWTRIDFSLGPKWIEAMFARSRAAPLTVTWDGATLGQMNIADYSLGLIRDHLSHTRVLTLRDLRLGLVERSDAFRTLFCTPAPVLEALHVDFTDPRPHSFPHSLFATQAPALRTIVLSDFVVPWALLPYGRLTHVTVQLKFGHSSNPVSPPSPNDFDDFLTFLEHVPMLETLKISSRVPRVPPSYTDERIVRLPRLRTLHLEGRAIDCLSVLKALRFPATATMFLDLISSDSDGAGCCAVLPLLSSYLVGSNPTHQLPRTMSMRPCGDNTTISSLLLELWTGEREDDNVRQDPAEEPHIVLQLHWGGPPAQNLLPVMRRVCNALPLAEVEALTIESAGCEWTVEFWKETFTQCQSVRFLSIKHDLASTFCEAAMPDATPLHRMDPDDFDPSTPDSEIAEEPAGPRLFPQLESLSMDYADFRDSSLRILFFRWLSLMSLHPTSALKKLDLEGCNAVGDVIDDLRDLVQEVVWAGEDEDEVRSESDGLSGFED